MNWTKPDPMNALCNVTNTELGWLLNHIEPDVEDGSELKLFRRSGGWAVEVDSELVARALVDCKLGDWYSVGFATDPREA